MNNKLNRRTVCTTVACLATLMGTACDAPDTDDNEIRNAILPVTATNAQGEEFLAGSYDARTGELSLTPVIVDGLEQSVGETKAQVTLAGDDGVMGEVELELALGYAMPDLHAGTELELIAEMADEANALVVGTISLRERAWTQGILEHQAATSFANCYWIDGDEDLEPEI